MRLVVRVFRWTFGFLVVVLFSFWLALPSLVRYGIMTQGSRALRTEVKVGIVDISLWNGRVRIQDLAVADPLGAKRPLIGWRLLQVTLSYRAVFDKVIRLREVVLDTPQIALDRLADGKLNLQQLVAPPTEAAPAETKPEAKSQPESQPAAAPAGPSWGFALDRFVLRGGGLHFRDLVVPNSEPLAIDIPAVEVADVSFQPGLYGEPSHAVLDVRTEGSHIRLAAITTLLEKGIDVKADLDATGLPLRRARVYVTGVGWSELKGLADASFKYHLRTDAKNELAGSVTVRKLAVATPSLDRPALAWDRLLVRLDPVDLLKRSAIVSLVELKGASVVASLQGGEVLPLVGGKPGAPEEAPAPAPAAAAPPPAAESTPPPWKWRVNELRIVDSQLFLLRPGPPLPVGIRLAMQDIAPEPEKIAKVELGLDVGSGSFVTTGSLRLSPPAFGGTLRYEKLDLPTLISTSPSVPQKLIDGATLGGELSVEAGLDANGAAAAAEDLRVRGRLSLDKFRVVGADPKEFQAGLKRLEVTIDDARIPGVLATKAPPKPSPIDVKIAKIRVDEPFARLTRTSTGIVLPTFAATPAAKPAAPPKPPPAGSQKPAAAPPAPQVTVESVDVRGGLVAVVDRTVKPYFSSEIRPIALEAKGVKSDGPSAEAFRLTATGFQKGTVEIRGNLKADGSGEVDVDGKRLGLTPLNPYVVAASPYSLGSGSLSVATKAAITKDRYDTKTQVTVHGLGLQGAEGDTLFSQQFGITLSTAVALLTDLHGDITLDVPVVVDHGETKVDVGTVIRGALKSAIMGAVTSPLKLIGMVTGGGESGAASEPTPLPMLAGRAEPSPEGAEQVEQLASLLASRPGIGLTFTGVVGAADVRWLHEQKLRVELEKGPGVVGTITGIAARNARKRILAALQERAAGGAGSLDADDSALLEKWLKDEAPPTADDLTALAKHRAERLVAALRDEHGIEERRLTVVEAPPSDPSAGQPGVKIAVALPG